MPSKAFNERFNEPHLAPPPQLERTPVPPPGETQPTPTAVDDDDESEVTAWQTAPPYCQGGGHWGRHWGRHWGGHWCRHDCCQCQLGPVVGLLLLRDLLIARGNPIPELLRGEGPQHKLRLGICQCRQQPYIIR